MPNQAKRPPRSPLPLVVAAIAAVLLAGGTALLLQGRPPVASTAQVGGAGGAGGVGGPFTLTNATGKTVTAQDFRGKYMLVYFGYTFCPDVCPTTLNDVAAALDKMGAAADRVQPVFITVDPARDTPDVIRQYTAAFSPRLQGLTGTADQIATVAKEYHVYYAKHDNPSSPADYTVDHSSVLYVMGPDGGFIGVMRADEGADAIARDLAKLIT